MAAGDPIISLQGLDPLYVNFSLPEQYNTQISVGLSVQIRVNAGGVKPVTGEVIAIEPFVDAITRNFGVQATIRNPEDLLRPGMYANVEVPLGEPVSVTVVPKSAVSYRLFGTFVYVLTPENTATDKPSDSPVDTADPEVYKVNQRFVTLGASLGDLVVVIGLAPGETVASSGLLKLQPGGLARISNTLLPDAEPDPSPPSG